MSKMRRSCDCEKDQKGRVFYGCKEYPNCDFVSWDEPSMEKCPQCGKTLLKKKGKNQKLYCITPDCGYEKVEERMSITVIGAGLAGCEAAWQIASKGEAVTLYEMKPKKYSPAHSSEQFAELICSNSFKADRVESAAGLLKEEMRRFSFSSDGMCGSMPRAGRRSVGGRP